MLAQGLQAQATPNPFEVRSTDRINSVINDQQRVVLQGQVHPLARAEFDRGAAPAEFAMERMILTMRGDVTQEAALDALVESQRNPTSSLYKKWLTPEEFGEHFGVSQNDTIKVESWLQGHGFQVEEVSADRRSVVFSGTSAQVQAAFQTSIHVYNVNGTLHHANANAPEIPTALSGVVVGVVSLNDFFSTPQHASGPAPAFDSGSAHYLTPGDLAIIYDVVPLYSQGLDGSGQSIAVVGRADIKLSDIRTFRSSFGLPAKDPTIIHPGASPGMANIADATEAALDVEWAGALGKKATVKYVPAASTSTTDGVYLSAEYIVNNNLAPVVSVSYAVCERTLGTAANKFMSNLWQQAAAQGMSVFVSAGDSGAAGCDSPTNAKATGGDAVNGLCSTPYNVCVGGTQFNDTTTPSLYWSASDVSGTQSSALNYIPEKVWNESGTTGLYSTGGGASTTYAKPAWQSGLGVPKDGKRDVPDLSLTAAAHDGYLIYFNGNLTTVGGTSLASPSLASIMALLVQHTENAQGNPNARLYALAGSQRQGGAAVFHDITSGNNSVPGVTGFTAGNGYDQATGLGSVDARLLVNHWNDPTAEDDALGLQLSLSASSQSVAAGHAGAAINVTSVVTGSDTVAFTASGLPAGVTAAFAPASLGTPGSGSSALTLTVASTAVNGAYTITVTGTPGTITNTVATASLTLNITGGQYITISASPTAQSGAEGGTATFNVTATGSPSLLTYQWHSQAPGGSDTPIAGATKSNYTTAALTLSQDQVAYWVVVSNSATSQTSSSALLSVTPKAPVITSQPVNQTVILNGSSPTNAIFVVGDSGEPGTTYQWQQCGPTSSSTLCAAAGSGWASVSSNGTSASYNTGALTSTNNGTQYRVVLSDALCNPPATGSKAVTSTAASVNVQYVTGSGLTAQSVNEGAAATFSVTAGGNPTTYTYQWYAQAPAQPKELILGATTSSYKTPVTTVPMSGTLYSVVVSNAAMSWTSAQVALTVNPGAPVILTQPVSLTVVANGTNTATFTVVTDLLHPGTTYLWKKKGVSSFAAAPGTNTNASYTTPAVASTDNGAQFEVTLTDGAGSVTSSAATLTVNYVTIGTEPNSPSAPDGKLATFTVAGTGNPSTLTYQWYSGLPGSGTPIAGATTSSLAFPSVTNSQNGAKYYVAVSNSATTTTSTAGMLTVTPPGPSIANQPQSQAAIVGKSATFTVVPVAEPSAPVITYQWQKSTDGSTWPSISGATSATYQTPATAIINNGTQYRVLLSDTTGTTTSGAATLSVEYITINNQPSAVTAQAGTSVTFVVSAVGNPGLQYQWYSQPPAGSFAPITNAIHSSYTIPAVASIQDGTQYYVCVFNSAIACSNATQSPAVTLNVTTLPPAAPVISSQPSNQTTASSSATFTVGATGVPAATIQWLYSINNGSTWTNVPSSLGTVVNTGTTSVTSTLTLAGLTGSNDQTQFEVILTNTKGTVTSSAATLSVKHITTPPVSQTVMTGQAASFTVTATATPTSYQWKVMKLNSTYQNVAEASGTTSSYTTGVLDSSFDQAQYEVVISYNGMGTVTSSPVTLSVNYVSAQPSNQTTNTGNTANFMVTATGTPTSYQWKVKKLNSSYQNVGEASGLSNNYTTGMLGSSYDQAQYEVVVSYGALGTLTSSPATLSVNYISTQPVSQSADTGGTAVLSVTATGVPTAYQWQKSTNSGQTWINVSEGSGGQTSSFTTGALTYPYNGAEFQVQVTYGALGTITSSPATVSVNYIKTQPSNQTANTGGAATFTVTATGTVIGYQWNRSPDGSSWTPVSGATAKSYTTGELSSADNGAQFQVVITYALGTVTSSAATLSINSITSQPAPTTANQGASATFTVAANNAPTTYQWRISQNHGVSWSDISSSNSASYTRLSLAKGDDEDLFAVVLTYPQGQITSQAVMLSVNYINIQPNSPIVLPGSTATFAVSASGSPTYQWQVNKNDGLGFNNVSTSDGSTGSTSYLYTTGPLTSSNDQYQYQVLVGYGSTPITSATGVLSVKFITIGTAPQNATIVSGTTNTFTVSATGTANVALHYQWWSQPFGGGAVMVGTNSASYTTATTANGDNQTTVWVVVSDGGLVAAVTSASATLTVQPVPIISIQPTNPAQANVGDTPTLSVTALNGTGTQWQSCIYPSDCTSGSNWNPISGATSASYMLPAVTPANDQTEYRAIISNGVGGITSSPVTLTVSYVTIDAFLVDAEVTAGQPAVFMVFANGTVGSTLVYEWHLVTAGGTPGISGDSIIGGATTSSYQISNANSGMNGEMIYVKVTNGLGGTGVAVSEPVTLLVD